MTESPDVPMFSAQVVSAGVAAITAAAVQPPLLPSSDLLDGVDPFAVVEFLGYLLWSGLGRSGGEDGRREALEAIGRAAQGGGQ